MSEQASTPPMRPSEALKVLGAPSRYVQGDGATFLLGQELRQLGHSGTILLVASQVVRQQLEAIWREVLDEEGIALEILTFGGECSQSEIDAGCAAAEASAASVIIGAGGGKCLDTARAIAGHLDLPAVCCPSLASSDAPCSALSAVYTDDGDFDHYIFYKKNPDLVLVDTRVIANAPVRYLIGGLGDAIATWFEARTVVEARSLNQLHGTTTMSGAALARLCYDTLIEDAVDACRSVEVGAVTPALERIVEANTLLSGLGFESGGLAIAHSVHNGLTTARETHDYLHGEKVAFGLLVQLVVEGRPSSEIETVLAFNRSVGLPVSLADLGLTSTARQTLEAVAERAVAESETAHHEPFTVSAQMIYDGILAADAIQRG